MCKLLIHLFYYKLLLLFELFAHSNVDCIWNYSWKEIEKVAQFIAFHI